MIICILTIIIREHKVEVNEGYSVGAYGLDSIKHAKLLSTIWAELTGTDDLTNW